MPLQRDPLGLVLQIQRSAAVPAPPLAEYEAPAGAVGSLKVDAWFGLEVVGHVAPVRVTPVRCSRRGRRCEVCVPAFRAKSRSLVSRYTVQAPAGVQIQPEQLEPRPDLHAARSQEQRITERSHRSQAGEPTGGQGVQ